MPRAEGSYDGTHMDGAVHYIELGAVLAQRDLRRGFRAHYRAGPRCTWPKKRVQTVGIDYLFVGGYHSDGAKIHKILLQARYLDHRRA